MALRTVFVRYNTSTNNTGLSRQPAVSQGWANRFDNGRFMKIKGSPEKTLVTQLKPSGKSVPVKIKDIFEVR